MARSRSDIYSTIKAFDIALTPRRFRAAEQEPISSLRKHSWQCLLTVAFGMDVQFTRRGRRPTQDGGRRRFWAIWRETRERIRPLKLPGGVWCGSGLMNGPRLPLLE